ncbi:MAG: hypothetical protein AB1374_02905 [Bacillota bacterium]
MGEDKHREVPALTDEMVGRIDLFHGIRHQKKRAFLVAFVVTGTILNAAQTANIDRTSHYFWLKTDPEYAEAFEEAEKLSADLLADEAYRRAVKGVRRPIYQGGKLVGHELVYSDTLLMFLAKARNRQKYDDKAASNQPAQVNIKVTLPDEYRHGKIIEAEIVGDKPGADEDE